MLKIQIFSINSNEKWKGE